MDYSPPKLSSLSSVDNLTTLIKFLRCIQRASKVLKTKAEGGQPASTAQNSAKRSLPHDTQLLGPNQAEVPVHADAESAKIAVSKATCTHGPPRIDDQKEIANLLIARQGGVTKAQQQRLECDILHGRMPKQDYIDLCIHESNFAYRLLDALHDEAEAQLRMQKSPYALARPPSIPHSDWSNSRHNAIKSAKIRILRSIDNDECDETSDLLDIGWLFG